MNGLLAALLVPLYFTAPMDRVGPDAAGRVSVSGEPVQRYVFHRLDGLGRLAPTPGYADSGGSALLAPHKPGTRETVWLLPAQDGGAVTIYVMSLDRVGNLSAPSNGCVIGHSPGGAIAMRREAWMALDVPLVKQPRERCGQAALAMVLRYYGADPAALRRVDATYNPVLRGVLITDLAAAARRAGYDAAVATLTPDSLIHLLNDGVPPILLYENGSGSVTVKQFGVVTGWDASRGRFTLHDGGPRARMAAREDLAKRWQTAGSQALIIRLRVP